MTDQDKPPRKRGFALLDANKIREVAALGGKTAHRSGHAHRFTVAEARAAAAKSVEIRRRRDIALMTPRGAQP